MQTIINSHFHIWRKRTALARRPNVPRIFGPYEPIRRDYPIENTSRISVAPASRRRSMSRPTGPRTIAKEVACLSGTAAHTGWPHAIVGYCDMTVDERARNSIASRAIRGCAASACSSTGTRHQAFRLPNDPRQVVDPKVRANVRHLKDYGLSFDLQLFPAQMKDGLQLVGENPETDFILTHTGMLTASDAETVEAWRDGLRTLAKAPNLYAKLSGLGTFEHRNDPALIAMIYAAVIEILCSDRLMFGSNFPIEKLWTSHADLVAAHRAAAAKFSAAEQADIFHGTAAKVYRPG